MGIPDLSEGVAARSRPDAVRDDFPIEALGSLSHDLNNALSVILTSSTSLLRKEPADPTSRRQLELMHRSAIRIHALSDEFSDALAVSSGQVELKLAPLELGQLIQEAIEITQQLAPQRILRVSGSHDPLWIRGDQLRLRRVFAHLLRSALSATPSEDVEVVIDRGASDARVSVHHSSPGSPPDAPSGSDESSAFHPAEIQRRSLARYVSQGVLRAHGGQLSIEPRREGGCEFAVSLPIAERSPAPASS